MRQSIKFSLPVLIIIIAAILAFVLFPVFKQAPEKVALAKRAVMVDVLEVERRSLQFTVHSQGIVKPRTSTTLVAEVAGKITQVATEFVSGGYLAEGEVLLEIDPSDYRVGVKGAEAALASREAQLASEKARSEQAMKDWRRLHGNKGKPNDLVLRIPQLAEAHANVRAAEADLERARRNLQRTTIRMPYAGLVKEKRVDIGQYVSPGTPLGATFAVDLVEVRLPVTTQELEYIDLPDYAHVSPQSFPAVILTSPGSGHQWQARIVRSEGVVDSASRQVYLVAQVRDPYGLLGAASGRAQTAVLKIGAFVSAQITGRQATDLFVVPRHSLGDGNRVMVASSENTLNFRQVELARLTPTEAYITAGLKPGDRVVVTALTAPIEGMAIRIRDDQIQHFGEQVSEMQADDMQTDQEQAATDTQLIATSEEGSADKEAPDNKKNSADPEDPASIFDLDSTDNAVAPDPHSDGAN